MVTQKAAEEIAKLSEEWNRNNEWERNETLNKPQTDSGVRYKWKRITEYNNKKHKIQDRINFIKQTGYATSELARLKTNLGKGRRLQHSESGGHRHGYVYPDEWTEAIRDDKTGFEGIVKYRRYPYSGQTKTEIIKMKPLHPRAVQKLINFGPKVNIRREKQPGYYKGRDFDLKPLKAQPIIREPSWGDVF